MPLPPDALDCRELNIRGRLVAVEPATLAGGTEVLEGTAQPALVRGLVGDRAAPEAGSPDSLLALSGQYAAATRDLDENASSIESLRVEADDLRSRAEEADEEIRAAMEAKSGLATRCAQLRQRIRDLLDAEEATC